MDLIGHEKIWTWWQELGAKRLPQTLLLVGAPSVGKKTLAEKAAKEILQATIIPLTSPSGQIISVDDVRALQDVLQVRWQAPVVILIEHAEHLRSDGNTALLKNIEEPAPNVYFWLLAPSRESVLGTIASRAAVVSLAPVPGEIIWAALAQSGAETALIDRAVVLAEGRPGVALRYATDPEWREWLATEEARWQKLRQTPQLGAAENLLKDLYGKKEDHRAGRAALTEVLHWWMFWLRQENPAHPALAQIAQSIQWLPENMHPRLILERIVLALGSGVITPPVLK